MGSENILVAVRVKPSESNETSHDFFSVTKNRVNIKTSKHSHEFFYDNVYQEANNSQIYDHSVRSVIEGAMSGFNGTVFAYGQTNSGKTHTMMGVEGDLGIIPLAVLDIFKIISNSSKCDYLLRFAYLEIYNEQVYDLLSKRSCQVLEDADGVFVDGLTETIVKSPKQVFKILLKASGNRHVSQTDWNMRSSRSHTIFQIVIEARQRSGEAPTRSAVVSLIDLAGSEKASTDANRKLEGKHINRSLLTLGNVIAKLSEPSAKGHIPFRESKLTRILQQSLEGNAKISVICTVHTKEEFSEETLNTLKFASKLKKVTLNPHANVNEKGLLEKYKQEIDELKSKLVNISNQYNSLKDEEQSVLELERAKFEQERRQQETLTAAFTERIEHLTAMILSSQSKFSQESAKKRANSLVHRGSLGLVASQSGDLAEKLREKEDLIEEQRRMIEKLEEKLRKLELGESIESPLKTT